MWRRDGIDLRLCSFLREADLPRWYGPSHLGRVSCVLRGLLRLPLALVQVLGSDVVLVQREAMPLGPPVLEYLASRWRPLVWDVDDAVWNSYVSPTSGRVPRWLRATGAKFQRIATWADEVWAGSAVLASWAGRHSENVTVVPTVVDVPETLPEEGGTAVGWIGSHSTAQFLTPILPELRDIEPGLEVLAVGAPALSTEDPSLRAIPWSMEAERDALDAMRVGLYPVDENHPLADGKCGLKAILYMAHGIPPVVTPTRPNADIVRDGIDGLHARTPAEWRQAVTTLLRDDAVWERCRRAGYAAVCDRFSMQVWAPRLAARLRTLAADRAS